MVQIGSVCFLTLGFSTHFASCYLQSHLFQCYVINKQEKRHAYDERVRKVEKACFSPEITSDILDNVQLLEAQLDQL